ncbi:MAG: glycosyltransferase family 2 protein [Syntrophorhabdaceae bacterium]
MVVLIALFLLLVAYLTFSVFYHAALAVSYFMTKERAGHGGDVREHRYLLFIPAHNEEPVIGRVLKSLKHVDYDRKKFEVCVIADNCTDKTASLAQKYGASVLERHDEKQRGKGFAIKWALGKIDLARYDAVVIADADNIFDRDFFKGFDDVLSQGIRAVQCNNCLANYNETAFTKIIHLSRTINNQLYHHAKHKLGLSSCLMGNGMCFTTDLLREHPWVTGTMAEDCEYYALLSLANETIGFASRSSLYHQESRGLRAASAQRLRWSSGRFQVARKFGFDLFIKGIRKRKIKILDASFPLLLPNLSLMVNMTGIAFIIGIGIHFLHPVPYIVGWLGFLIALEIAYFASGIYLAKVPVIPFLRALCFAPAFLLWKACIDIVGLSGKGTTHWGRSGRIK